MDLHTGSMELRDSFNLKVNPGAPQVFNFCTIWGLYQGGAASTHPPRRARSGWEPWTVASCRSSAIRR
jgi:hypothetical protein